MHDLARDIKNALEKISYDRVAIGITVATEVQLPNSHVYYKYLGKPTPIPNCPAFAGDTAPLVECLNDARTSLMSRNPDHYDRVIYIGENPGTGVAAQGTVNRHDVFVTPKTPLFEELVHIVLHELGHSFGWRHASSWLHSPPPLAPSLPPLPREANYGDGFDIMGDFLQFHWFGPWFLHRIGWLKDSEIDVVTSPGPRTIAPIECGPGNGKLALKIPLDENTNAWIYWRRYEGGTAASGPLISFEYKSTASRSFLYYLHGKPSATGQHRPSYDAAMVPAAPPLLGGPFAFPRQYWIYDPVNLNMRTPLQEVIPREHLFRVDYFGLSSSSVVQGCTPTPQAQLSIEELPLTVAEAPIIGLAHVLPNGQRRVHGKFTYEVTAYMRLGRTGPVAKNAGNGDGIASVEMAVFERNEALAQHTFYGPPRTVVMKLNPKMPSCVDPILKCVASANYTLGPPAGGYHLRVDTSSIPNGRYMLVVKATARGSGASSTVQQWEHVIYNP